MAILREVFIQGQDLMQDWQQQIKQLQQWWQTPAGENMLRIENAFLRSELNNVFGYQAVIVGGEEYSQLTNIVRTSHCMRIDPLSQDFSHLPDKIDVMVLPHMFSFIEDLTPWMQALLAKLETNGKVIITGYRYSSVLGLQRLLKCKAVADIPTAKHNVKALQQHFITNDFQLAEEMNFAAVWVRKRLSLFNHQLNNALLGNVFAFSMTKKLATVKTFKPEWQVNNIAQQSSVLNSVGEQNE